MREVTETYKLYTFDELSESAKRNAYEKWYHGQDTEMLDWDYRKVLDDLANTFHFSITDYEVGMGISYRFDTDGVLRDAEEINDPLRLTKWVINNWYDKIVKYKHIGDWSLTSNGMYSKIQREHYCLPISGMCYEADFMDVLEAVISYKLKFDCLYDLLDACLHKFFCQWADDRDYETSYEHFCEMPEMDEAEFYENGDVA